MSPNRRAARSSVRLRGGGCTVSRPAEPNASEFDDSICQEVSASENSRKDYIQLPSGGFASGASELFKEYLGLLGRNLGETATIDEITSSDVLLVIDMQRDFVPKSSDYLKFNKQK